MDEDKKIDSVLAQPTERSDASDKEEVGQTPDEFFKNLSLDLADLGSELSTAIRLGDKKSVKSVIKELTDICKGLGEIKKNLSAAVKQM